MNTFAVLLLCVQACLVQSVVGQNLGSSCRCGGRGYGAGLAGMGIADGALVYGGWNGGLGYGAGALGCGAGALGYEGLTPSIAPTVAPAIASTAAAYGGEGIGNVAVAGEMAVGGTTVVTGQVPVIGAVRYGGNIPAAGAVSITAKCGCGCDGSI